MSKNMSKNLCMYIYSTLLKAVFLCFPPFPRLSYVFPCFPTFSPIFARFSLFSHALCFHCFLLFPLFFIVFPTDFSSFSLFSLQFSLLTLVFKCFLISCFPLFSCHEFFQYENQSFPASLTDNDKLYNLCEKSQLVEILWRKGDYSKLRPTRARTRDAIIISCGHTTDFYLGKSDSPRANSSKISRGKFISGFVLPRWKTLGRSHYWYRLSRFSRWLNFLERKFKKVRCAGSSGSKRRFFFYPTVFSYANSTCKLKKGEDVND